jgi:methylated-DNA-[protein]-cysteine S-methyltransferase
MLAHAIVPSPLGEIDVLCDEDALLVLEFRDHRELLARHVARRFPAAELKRARDPLGVARKLGNYFDGDLQAFDDIPTEPGGTPFLRRVWDALLKIRCGTTTSYGALAAALGQPSATRAVGLANGRNPISLVIPCHRVIGADGSLTGYGGGLHRKRWLLAHESKKPMSERLL